MAPTSDDEEPPAFATTTRAIAALGMFVLIPLWLIVAFNPPERCTTSEAPPPSTAGATAPTATSIGAVTDPQRTKTCQAAGLTEPPLAVLGLVTLLLAFPVLGLSEVAFAGLSIKRSAEKAAAAAKEATSAAQQAAAAATSIAAAQSSSASSGNVVVFGSASEEFAALDAGVALTYAASGVIAFLRGMPDVLDASVLWLDQATSSLRPATDASSSGADAAGDLGEAVRRSLPLVIEIADGRPLGLQSTQGTARAVAIPARLPPEPAVGLVLAVLDPRANPQEVSRRVETVVRAVALHITAFTAAGRRGENKPPW